MSPVVTEILQQIDRLSPIEQAQILQHLTHQTEKSTMESSKLVDVVSLKEIRLTELLQAEGCYEDDYIRQSMSELETQS